MKSVRGTTKTDSSRSSLQSSMTGLLKNLCMIESFYSWRFHKKLYPRKSTSIDQLKISRKRSQGLLLTSQLVFSLYASIKSPLDLFVQSCQPQFLKLSSQDSGLVPLIIRAALRCTLFSTSLYFCLYGLQT